MELDSDQKNFFYQNGFVKLPGIVSKELVEAALWEINHFLGRNGIHPDRLTEYNNQSYLPEIMSTPPILNLMTESPIFGLVEELVGSGNILPITQAQIALRFPHIHNTSKEINYEPHLDGLYTPENGVTKGTVLSFTGLIGIFLSDLPHENMSNFMVWPGSHHIYEEYFRKNTPNMLLNGLEGMPEVELPPLLQITAKAGDAILCHYQLGHTAVLNSSPYIRYAVFFRFFRKGHLEISIECLTDIWREWDGMQEFTENRKSNN